MDDARALRRARRERRARMAWYLAAVVGAAAGLQTLWMHVTTDPLADVRAYYDAGARLNAGLPLYPAGQDVNANTAYFYPPLFAILFRPLAMLPFPVAATIWGSIVVLAFVATLHRLGLRRRETWVAVGVLAFPIAWVLAVAQAQSLVTWLLTLGTPAAVALAGQIKVFPVLAGAWWVGRREWRAVGRLAGWSLALVALQFVLEPRATVAFIGAIGTGWVGEVRNISPYAISPFLWLVVVAALLVAAVRWARSPAGWPLAVALATFAPPRLLSYMLMTLIAALREPRSDGGDARRDPPR